MVLGMGFCEGLRVCGGMIATLAKTETANESPHLGFLSYCATPLTTHIKSPVELLNIRKYRGLFPTRSSMQQERREQERGTMINQKEKQHIHHDKYAREPKELNPGDKV